MADGEERFEDEATKALERHLASTAGQPQCARCRGSADFFLFEPGRVAKFVCWEHVSPVSAAVAGDVAAADRPVAIPLTAEFERPE